jgi:hypothetical protein
VAINFKLGTSWTSCITTISLNFDLVDFNLDWVILVILSSMDIILVTLEELLGMERMEDKISFAEED